MAARKAKKLPATLEKRKDSLQIQEITSETLLDSSQDDITRSKVAERFVGAYFFLLTIILIGVPLYNSVTFAYLHETDLTLSLRDVLLTFSAIVGPTMGLVIAYYFKSKTEL